MIQIFLRNLKKNVFTSSEQEFSVKEMFISHVIFWNQRIKNTLNKKKICQNIYTMNAEKDIRNWMQYYC